MKFNSKKKFFLNEQSKCLIVYDFGIYLFSYMIDCPGCSRISFWQQVPTILTPQCGQKNGVKIGSINSTIQGGPQWSFLLDIVQKY